MHRVARHAQRLFELSSDLLAIVDADLRVVGANPAWERVLARRPDDVIGMHFEELTHPDDLVRTREATAHLAQHGDAMQIDTRLLHADGSTRWIRWAASRDPEDRLIYAAGRDVTAEVRAAEAVRASERRLAEAERIARLGSVDWCPEDGSVAWSEGMYRLYGLPPGSPPLSEEEFAARMRSDEAARHRAAAVHAAATLGTWELDLHIIDAHGRPRALESRCEAYREDGRVRFRAAMQDVTSARRHSQQQVEVARLAQLALAGGDREAFLREVCAAVSRILDTSLSAIAEVREDGSAVALSGIGWAKETEPSGLAARGPSLSRVAVESGRPIVVDDWRAEERFPYALALREAGIRSTAVMPIAGRDRPFGVLATNSREPGFLRPDDIAFLEAVAAILATAIERFRAEQEVAELAAVRGRLVAESVEAEERARRRISEELHDGVLQDLLAARQDLIEAGADADGRDRMLAAARAGVERAVGQLRDAVHALHPIVLQHGGLVAALQAAAEQAGRQGGFAADVAVRPDAMGVRDELVLSVARELLTNAAKHAGASRVAVTVWREDDTVVLEVEDDGRGIDLVAAAQAPLHGHIGLAALGQRVEATGGTFTATPLAGRPGTVVRAVIPVA